MRDGVLTQRHKGMGIGLWLCLLLLLPGFPVLAAENVHFGSAAYRWEAGTVNPIGVYVEAEEEIGDYEICLVYDSSVLRYVDGASEQEGNTLYLRGTGSEALYKIMLHFEALQEGGTELSVVSAVGHTLSRTTVSGGDAQTVGGRELQLNLPVSAPIEIYQDYSVRLTELSVGGLPLEGFLPDVTEYSLTVPSDTERLELDYTSEDGEALVTVSDQSLSVGENRITLTVQSGGQEGIYTLRVTRQEPEPAPAPAPETSAEPTKPPAPAETQTPEPDSSGGESRPEEEQRVSPSGAPDEEETSDVFPVQWLILGAGCLFTGILLVCYAMFILKNRIGEKKRLGREKEEVHVINLESTVIRVSHVTMRFKMARDEASSLKEYLIRWLKRQNQFSWLTALDDVSFEVNQGDVLGIIGTNGSGKSTVLKIVSGVLKPTAGQVEVDKSKVQMLTLGTGFDMELTARENVYLNGSIIGYTREYIDEKYDDIVRFAELEGFMDERMKNFSSGMVSRLGFAIATMRDTPEILILDEVLSVGDTFFQKKSMERIRQMIHGGATVLIVSHNMNTIRKNCNRVIWIEKGELRMDGDAQEVCAAYERMQK